MPPAHRRSLLPLALAAAASLLLASPASANAGAPLGLATLTHLVIGCALIGLIEGLLISRILRSPRRRTILLLIAANYLSAWIGHVAMLSLREFLRESILPGPALLTAHKILLILLPTAIALSVLFEYPFALLAARAPRRPRRVLAATLAAHALSYPLLFLWYSTVSSTSLYTRTIHDHTLSFVPADLDAWIYYIHPDDGSVWRIRPTGRDNERIADAQLTHAEDVIFAWTTPEGRNDLRAPGPDRLGAVNILENFAATAVVHPRQTDPEDFHSFNKERGKALDLRPLSDRGWSASTTWYAKDGLKASNDATGNAFNVAFENPLFPHHFYATNATILPGDLVVYQLGELPWHGSESHIVILDLNTRTLGLLARGRYPVVGLGSAPPQPEPLDG